MDNLLAMIEQVSEHEVEDVLKAVLRRYGELFPDWEISTISVNKKEDRNKQIDQIIEFVNKMR